MVLIFPEGTRTPRRRDRPVPPRLHHAGGPLEGGHPAGGHRRGVSGLAALAEVAAAWAESASITASPIPPAEIAGRDERELLAEVERRVRECHAEIRRHKR